MRNASGRIVWPTCGAWLLAGAVMTAGSPVRAENWFQRLFDRTPAPSTAPAATPVRPVPPAPAAPSSPAQPAPPAAAAPSVPAPAAAPPAAQPAPALPQIPVAYPKVQRFEEHIELTGTSAAVNSVKLVARVPGFLEDVHFADGQTVDQGALLFTIEQAQYKAQLAQAEAQVRATEAALAYARREVERYAALQKRGAAAQVVVDNWNFQASKSEAELASARAQAEIARLNLSYTEVRAPFAGQMGKALVNVGAMVGGAGQPPNLGEIVQLDPIYVVANVSEQDLIKIRENIGPRRLTQQELLKVPVDVGIESVPSFHMRGFVEYIAPGIDTQTGTIMVRGVVANPDRALLPGEAVRIRLPRGKVIPDAVMVPDRAIQADQGGRYVLVVNAQNTIEQRYVKPGDLVDRLRIVGGVGPHDRIVIADLWRATPGLKVAPKLIPIDQAATFGSQ
ncbi:efflux RND transporter periplasmic adaptor subunit [Alsobacter sp. R-9]